MLQFEMDHPIRYFPSIAWGSQTKTSGKIVQINICRTQAAPIFFRMSSRSAFFNILPTGFRGMAATTSRRSGIL